MRYGMMLHQIESIMIDGTIKLTKIVTPAKILKIKNGLVSFKRGTFSKRGSYPNTHIYFSTYDFDLIVAPITEVVFIEGDIYDKKWRAHAKKTLLND